MNTFNDFLANITNLENRQQLQQLLAWICDKYPELEPVIKWNQPMFTDHDTYIIGFSVSKKHFAISPEVITMTTFMDEIEAAGYDHTANIIRVKWQQAIDYPLLKKIIEFNILDKAEHVNFWR